MMVIAVLAGCAMFLPSAALAVAEPLSDDGASIEFSYGETDRFTEGVQLFTTEFFTEKHVLKETPDWLRWQNFLRGSFDCSSFRVTAPGVLTMLTPEPHQDAESQSQTLEKLGFTRIEKPSVFQLFGENPLDKVRIYQKSVKAGDSFFIGKYNIVIGFSKAVPKVLKPWSENSGEKLYNGIVLPEEWPPDYYRDPNEPMPVPYLKNIPAIIPIDVGRQLFVDEFLIQDTTLSRTFHKPEHCPTNPVLKPDKPWEFTTKGSHAAPYGGGVWFDPADKIFKMWYTGGNMAATCYATSVDGINWEKPSLDVVAAGTNVVLKPGMDRTTDKTFDSTTIWIDESDPEARFKYFAAERASGPKRKFMPTYRTSTDGINWSEPLAVGGGGGDRSTVFYNPFRKVWVFSERKSWGSYSSRARAYRENADPKKLIAEALIPGIMWVATDKLDPQNPIREYAEGPALYNLDAAPYESLMLGQFSIWQGPENEICSSKQIQKRCDILIGYSRDGFHWDRPDRNRFISCSWDVNDWRFGNVQSVVGGCLVVGDKLYFYFSGRAKGDIGFYDTETIKAAKSWHSAAATGLAVLRRDGFASMDANDKGGTLTTRPLSFKGKYLFVNVDAKDGELRAEILDKDGNVMPSYTTQNCKPVKVDSTIYQIEWDNDKDLSGFAGSPVKIRFSLKNAKLYAFWVTPDKNGASHGYVAAGGPGFTGPIDTVGNDAYKKEGSQ
jgi:hypothetical protein